MRGNLLLMRWALLNLTFVVLGSLAWKAGLLAQAWEGDSTWVTTSILTLLAFGFVGLTARITQTSTMLDSVRGEGWGRVREFRLNSKEEWATDALKTKLTSRVRPYTWLANCMIMLGFFGTVWGMKMALAEISDARIQDASSAILILSALVRGFNVALWTTITGVACYFVLSFNIQLLMGGYERLYTKLLEDDHVVRREK